MGTSIKGDGHDRSVSKFPYFNTPSQLSPRLPTLTAMLVYSIDQFYCGIPTPFSLILLSLNIHKVILIMITCPDLRWPSFTHLTTPFAVTLYQHSHTCLYYFLHPVLIHHLLYKLISMPLFEIAVLHSRSMSNAHDSWEDNAISYTLPYPLCSHFFLS